MTLSIDALTEKEKDALRLLLRGHDAKSSALALGLSVHTVNERLREARRKLGTTSSREAARRLLAQEGDNPHGAPNNFGDKALGDAPDERAAAQAASSTKRWPAGSRLALVALGALIMSLIILLILAVLNPVDRGADAASGAAPVNMERVQTAARAWLAHIDKQDWNASYAASGAAFQGAISASSWGEAIASARQPHGRVLQRELLEYGSQSAPRQHRIVVFRTDFENKAAAIETVTLEEEASQYKVVGYWIK